VYGSLQLDARKWVDLAGPGNVWPTNWDNAGKSKAMDLDFQISP